MEPGFLIEPAVYLLCALWLLVLPLRWGIGAALAVFVHELCHIVMMKLLGVRIHAICIGSRGVRIESEPMSAKKEMLCALAGPLGSFSLLLLSPHFPEAALWALAQGLYNLLPFYPLDGGRALRTMLPDAVCTAVEAAFLILLGGISAYAAFVIRLGFVSALPFLSVVFLLLNRKIPCKDHKTAVQ